MKNLAAFNFNKQAIEKFATLKPIDKDNLAIDQAIKEWGPAVKKRLPSIRGKLL